MTGPYQRPLGDETYAWLGRKVGSRDHDYYLFADGDVWCLSSSESMYAAEWWWRLTAADRDRRLTGGRTVAELVRDRGPVPGRPPAGPTEPRPAGRPPPPAAGADSPGPRCWPAD